MRKLLVLLLVPLMAYGSWPMSNYLFNHDCAWQPSIDVVGRVGNFRKGGGAVLFAPVGQDECSLLFVQGLVGRFREQYAGSIGLGYRRTLDWGFAGGVNGFFDAARTNSGHVYYQGGLGLELIGNCWVARVNGYFPGRGDYVLSTRRESVVRIDGNDLISTDTYFGIHEQGYPGFDAEFGYGVELGCGQLWGYAGYYRYDQHGVKIQDGPRLRLEYILDINPFEIKAGGEWERNDLHGSTISAVAGIRIPLGRYGSRSTSCCDSICRQMGDPVFRNNTIWIDPEERIDVVRDELLVQQIFFADQDGTGGNGTQALPDTLVNAQGMTGPNDILFCLPNTGTIDATALGTYVMAAGEQIHSFGANGVGVVDLGQGRTLFVRPLGIATSQAIIQQMDNTPIIQLTSNNIIRNITLDGGGVLASVGVATVADVDRFVLDGATIQNINNNGILGAITNLLVTNSQILNITTDEAITLQATSAPVRYVEIRDSILTDCGEGILAENEGQFTHFVIRNNRLSDMQSGIRFESPGSPHTGIDVLLAGNTFDDLASPLSDVSDVASGSRVRYLITDNQIGQTTPVFGSIAISYDGSGGPSPTQNQIVVDGNVYDGTAIFFQSVIDGFNPDLYNILVEGNSGSDGVSDSSVFVSIRGNIGPSKINTSIRQNRHENDSPEAMFPGYLLSSTGNGDKAICGTLVGNTTNNGDGVRGVQLDNGDGTSFRATALPELGLLNGNVGLELVDGPFTNTIFPCPTPPVNPFHGGLAP